ncbi:MAG: hypothetical protein DBX59_00640 [Bacillota bacterium]|nr:MAG: hypothetical protein DBX59_00640 [Bacillota bacterium]
MNVNLLFAAGTAIDLVIAGLLLITAIVGLCTGFMKNGLNNLCFLAKIVVAVLLIPVLKGIGFIAGLQEGIGSALSFLGENMQAAVAGAVMSVLLFIVLYILLGIVFWLIKKLLRAIFKPQRGLGKLLDRIFGAVFGVAFYGVVLFTLLGAVGTLPAEGIQNALAESKLQKINFMQTFCDEHLNIGDLLESLQGALPETPDDGTEGETPAPEEGGEELPAEVPEGGEEV